MPIYEYICHDCKQAFELMQKINDKPCSVCPNCQGKHVEKQVSAAGFQLKGSGWYVTDFKDKKPKECSKEAKSNCKNGPCSSDGQSS